MLRCSALHRRLKPRTAARAQRQTPIGDALDQILADRVFPGAVERTGAAPGLPRLRDAARPGRHPFQEFDRQKFSFARHDRSPSRTNASRAGTRLSNIWYMDYPYLLSIRVMEPRHLRYFVAVAEEGHVTRAAERLGIQQPPLSQQIRSLETELEVQLFRRKPRGMELTQAGEALLAEARVILDRVEHAAAATRRTARGEAGRIGLGFTSSASFHSLVPRVIAPSARRIRWSR